MNDNPLRSLRESNHLSQSALARHLGITSQVVLLNEMGVYGSCNPSILEYLADLSGEPAQLLSEQYDNWRKSEAFRALSSARSVRDVLGGSFPSTPGRFNFEDVRNWARFKQQFSGSLVGFCKIVKLQPSLVTAFEASNFKNNVDGIISWLEENSGVAHVN